MYKLTLLLAISFLFITPGSAPAQKESTWCLRFAVVERQDSSSENWGVWPDEAAQWWKKDGKKKFPDLCEAARENADLVLAWTRQQTTEQYSVLVQSGGVAPSAGPTPPTMAQTLGMECDANPFTGELSCYYEYRQGSEAWETRQRKLERLTVTISRVEIETGKLVPLASVAKKKSEGLKPGKAAFQSALKMLRKEAKKAGATNTRQ